MSTETTTETEVERLLKVREVEGEEESGENENIAQAEEPSIPEQIEVRLQDVERLQFENITLKRQLLQEQMNTTEFSLQHLVAAIKNRTGAPMDYDLVFDPQNGQIVRLVKPKNGTN